MFHLCATYCLIRVNDTTFEIFACKYVRKCEIIREEVIEIYLGVVKLDLADSAIKAGIFEDTVEEHTPVDQPMENIDGKKTPAVPVIVEPEEVKMSSDTKLLVDQIRSDKNQTEKHQI